MWCNHGANYWRSHLELLNCFGFMNDGSDRHACGQTVVCDCEILQSQVIHSHSFHQPSALKVTSKKATYTILKNATTLAYESTLHF